MKIIFFETRDKEKELLEGAFTTHELIFRKERLDKNSVALAKGCDIVSVFVGSEVDKEVINALQGIKVIITRSTGFDHIDVKYAKDRGILVSVVPAYGMHTVAEFAFGLMLSLSRNISLAGANTRKGDFSLAPELRGFDLFGKTLGVIGTGKIGKNIVFMGKGFRMKILATDLFPDQAFAEENEVEYVLLSVLLSSSDVVTVHAPYNETTYHLISKDNIGLMKKTALLINTARGEIVETQALFDALVSGGIAGAGLDVLEGERKLKSDPARLSSKELENIELCKKLIALPNVIVAPHIAFYSAEAEAEISKVVVGNISAFISGTPINIIK